MKAVTLQEFGSMASCKQGVVNITLALVPAGSLTMAGNSSGDDATRFRSRLLSF